MLKEAMAEVRGFHHVTSVCGPAQENIDFYCGVLGLRLLKLTVNYDDPSTYHLYFGHASGAPGSILSFFPYPSVYPGRPGRQRATVISLAIPRDAVQFWVDRFRHFEVEFDKPHNREGGQYIGFRAPDGLALELSAVPGHEAIDAWQGSDVPSSKAVGRIRSVTIVVDELGPTAALLSDVLNFHIANERDGHHRFQSRDNPACFLEVFVDPKAPLGRGGHGSVHHVAFQVADDADQVEIREAVAARGLKVSAILDRTYFKSIYFRGPGGVLFEVATEGPGFSVDEPIDSLGKGLMLPPQFAPLRLKLERMLPPLKIPGN